MGRINNSAFTWPKSLPDYKWPEHLLSRGMAAVRWLLAAVFHVAYAIGLLGSVVLRGRDRVLVIRTDGIGDALLFEPAMESLGRALSPRLIHLWAPRGSCDLLAHCPAISRSKTIPRGFKDGNLAYFRSILWRAKLGLALGFWKFDKAIYAVESPEPLGNWLFVTARATDRWLNYGDTINQFDWQQARTHLKATRIIENRPGNAHELSRNQYLANQWSDEGELRKPKLHLTEAIRWSGEAQADAWRTAARKLGGSEIVGVVPGASSPVNNYPDARWVETLQRIWDEQRAMPVLLGGPSDTPTLDRLGHELMVNKVPFLRLTNPIGLLELAATIGKMDGLISVDTAAAHFGVAQDVATIVLLAGGNPGRFFPWPDAAHHTVLTVDTPCAGCNNRCTMEEPVCLTHISPDDIINSYARLRGRRVPLEVYVVHRQAGATSSDTPNKLQAAG